MKTIFVFLISIFLTFANNHYCYCQASNITTEEIKNKCKGLKREEKVRITVTRFSVSSRAAQATGAFGDELTAIMTNAIQQTNCFRVLESVKNKADLESEIGYGESGATDGSGPGRGKQLGAQAIVTAEITEYNEGKSSGGAFGVNVGSQKAKIGIIVKIIDPESRELIWSESVSGEAKKSGFSGASIFGVSVAGSSKLSEAMSSAVEDLVLNTVSLMVKDKEEILNNLPDPSEGLAQNKSYNKTNCNMLKGFSAPKIMVIIPEEHLQRKIPDPAGETEILRKFIEAGFKAIDPSVYATLHSDKTLKEVMKDPMSVAKVGQKYGADIIIYGEAFSQFVSNEGGTITCRARVEAKAVRTDTGEILATNGLQAGGQDIAEAPASKTALKNAGAKVADYMLEQFCR